MHLLPNTAQVERENVIIDASLLEVSPDQIVLRSPIPLRTLSSGVCSAGIGWNDCFVNLHVDKNYNCSDPVRDIEQHLLNHDFNLNKAVGMMTAVNLKHVSHRFWEDTNFSLLVVVTAGVGNATDSTKASIKRETSPGTINTWIFVNGKLTEERSEEQHTSELQSRGHLVCRLLLEKKKNILNIETDKESV